MRLALTGTVMVVMAGIAYIASPFWTAWSLREAVRSGDKAHLERKIEWDSVRSTLKASLAQHAQLVPEITTSSEMAKPGLWQRVKMAFGQSMIDSFVERYVTPEGLPQLFEYRKTFNSKVRGEVDEAQSLPRLERFKRFWARLKRAEFMSLTQVEIEMEDRRRPDRRYISVLELSGFEWKLTGLRVAAAPPLAAPATDYEARANPAAPALR